MKTMRVKRPRAQIKAVVLASGKKDFVLKISSCVYWQGVEPWRAFYVSHPKKFWSYKDAREAVLYGLRNNLMA